MPLVEDIDIESLALAFGAARGEQGAPSAQLMGALEDLVHAVRQAWPRIDLDMKAFVEWIARRLRDGSQEESVQWLGELRAAEMYLAHACLAHHPIALQVLDRDYLSEVPRVVSRLRLSAADADEVGQLLRQRILVGTEGAPARLEQYGGRGSLRNWIRTAALRIAKNHLEAQARPLHAGAELDDDLFHEASGTEDDVHLGFLKREYGRQFKQAFEEAVAQLEARERNLLRFHHVDGLSSDALALTYGVHRATAARWVAAARKRLATLTRRAMMASLGVGRADLQSIMRLIESQLDVSVRRCLASDAASGRR